jgi:PAS domain S-box-containing protein
MIKDELEQLQQDYRDLMDSVLDAIVIFERSSGIILEVNSKACELYGIKRTAIIGMKYDALKSLKAVHFGKEGRENILEIKESEVNYRGRPAVLSIQHDITERKHVEKTLRESEAQYRLLAENVSDVIWMMDMDLHLTYASPSITRLMGYNMEEIARLSFDEVLTPASYQKGMQIIAEEMELIKSGKVQSGRSLILELEQKHKDGNIIWAETTITYIWNAEGKPSGILGITRDITKRKHAEDAIRESEDRYRTLAEAAHDIIFIINRDDRVIYVNQYAAEQMKNRPEEIIGYLREQIFPPEIAVQQKKSLQMVFDSRQPRYIENNASFLGRESWLGTWLVPLLDEHGDVKSVLGISRDVTERRGAAEALKESEEKYRRLVEESLQGLVIGQGIPPRIVFSNHAIEEMLGYSMEELISYTAEEIQQFIHPEDRAFFMQRYLDRLKGNPAPDRQEFRLIHKNGRICWVELRGNQVLFQGQPAVQTACLDITERKHVEQALLESEKKYRELIDHSLLGIYITQNHIMKFCNQRLAQIFGYEKAEDLIGIHVNKLVAPESWELVDEQVRLRESGSLDEVQYLFRGKRKDGRIIDLEVLGGRILYEGSPAIQGSMIDVTERNRLEAQLLQSQKMEAVGRLAGGVAHDFNNLLTTMMGYSDLLFEMLKSDSSMQEYVMGILNAAKRAANLTQQLLALSRRHPVQLKLLNLNEVVSDTTMMLKRLIGEHIEIILQLESALGHVKADPVQLEQILMNLAVNARDAMPRGGQLTIQTANVVLDESHAHRYAEAEPGNYVMLCIADTGHGMDAQIQEHLFEPFFTTKEVGKGTGLGLSTVYGIVKQSGGYIEVESAPGKGASFKIFFPGLKPGTESQIKETAAVVSCRGTETILLVEDDEKVRSLVAKILNKNGYTVLEACDGEEALRTIEDYQKPVHLLFTDIVMPRLSGPDLARRLLAAYPKMKVLFMSGYADGELGSYGDSAHDMPMVQKPFLPEVLIRRIREVLNGHPST